MEVIYEYCCGLDVHKNSITACMLSGSKKSILTFGTMTDDILDLVDWIKGQKCECVAMERFLNQYSMTKTHFLYCA